MTNSDVARRLRQYAADLTRDGDNLYRIRAVRQAVMTVYGLGEPIEQLMTRGGRAALEQVPGLGSSLAETIAHYVETGDWAPRELSHPRQSRLKRAGDRSVTPALRHLCSPRYENCSN